MGNILNPFRPTRWEHHSDGLPLIWFTQTALQLTGDKSTYVNGSRGSGKTSLLRSICWEDLLRNPSLKLQRTLGDSRHTGIYIRLPDHVSASLGFLDWKSLFPQSPKPELEFFRFFTLAIELICIEKALTACHEMRIAGVLRLDAHQETRLVTEVLDEYRELLNFADAKPASFLSLARLARYIVRRVNEATGRGTIAKILEQLPVREPNDLLTFVIERLSGVTVISSVPEPKSPGFKFCLDDCEVLNDLQKKSINTLVRKSRFPISWVICSVGDAAQIGDTFLPQQPLTEADRKVLSLDAREREHFRSICQAVASLRTYFAVPEASRPRIERDALPDFFSLTDRLGQHDVNDMMATMAGRSTSPYADLLRSAATALREKLFAISPRYRERFAGTKLPYSEAYILLHWTGKTDAFRVSASSADISKMLDSAAELRSPSFQAWMRRKSVSALLHMSSRLGFRRLPLAGANMIISLSDGSIRDFLEIMAEIYDKWLEDAKGETQNIEKFATSRAKIANKTQTDGIYRASQAFHDGISSQADFDPAALVRLIDALGKYTSLLQSNADDPTVMGRAERGVFLLDASRHSIMTDQLQSGSVLNLVKRAELAGYLRSASVKIRSYSANEGDTSKTWSTFRLHRRFSSYYRFSYRGAYEFVRLSVEPLWMLCRSDEPIAPDAWLNLVLSHPEPSQAEQLPLPWSSEVDDD